MSEFAPLAEDQIAALAQFADQNGGCWKARLSDMWMRAAADPVLHRLRNSHGPTWLVGYSLKDKR